MGMSKTYADITQEMLDWNAHAGEQAPKFGKVEDYARWADEREQSQARTTAYRIHPDTGQTMPPNWLQQVGHAVEGANLFPNFNPYGTMESHSMSTGAGATGAVAGSVLDQLANASSPFDGGSGTTKAFGTMSPAGSTRTEPTAPTPAYEPALEQAGQGVPRMAMESLLLGPEAGLGAKALGYGDSALAAYTPNADWRSAALAPLGMYAGTKVIPMAGQAAGRMAERAMLPDMQELVQASALPVGNSPYQQLTKQVFDTASMRTNTVQAAQMAGQIAGGTAVGEAQHSADELAHGRLPELSAPELAANVVQNLGFVGIHAGAAMKDRPENLAMSQAMDIVNRAQQRRLLLAGLNDTRGQRIADTHRAIVEDAQNGRDPTDSIEELKSHFIEADAVRRPTAREAGDVLMNIAEDANKGNMSELDLAQISSGVRGRFDELAKGDPESRLPGTVSGAAISALIERRLLPPISDEWLQQQFGRAYEQAIGDGPTARANLVNRIVAHYQDLLPGALERQSALPRAGGLTKTDLDARSEADKDASYIKSIVDLLPHMKGMKMPDGKTELYDALLNRDTELSNATQGNQLQAESRAWQKYDNWKTSLIDFVKSYDPVTRKGTWQNSVRMADQTVQVGEPIETSIEDLVDPSKTKVMTSRKIGRQSLTGRMLEYMDSRFGTSDAGEDEDAKLGERRPDERTSPTELGVVGAVPDTEQQTQALLKTEDLTGADYKPTEKTPPEVAAAWKEATEAGLTGDQRADYVRKATAEAVATDQPAFGTDVKKSERLYEVATYLASRLEKTDNDALWQSFGGEKVFGRGALAPGKAENFKNAILAKIEWDSLAGGKGGKREALTKLSPVQLDFLKSWVDSSGDTERTMPTDWREQTQLFRHAMRLYWRQVGNRFPDLIQSMLSDHPDMQNLLKATQMQVGKTSENLSPGETPTEKSVVILKNQVDPLFDSTRSFYKFGLQQGLSSADAESLARVTATLQQMLPENEAFGKAQENQPTRARGFNQAGTPSGRPWIAINFDKLGTEQAQVMTRVTQALQVFAHELTHNYTHPKPDKSSVFQQQRLDAHAKLAALFESMGPEPTDELLNRILPKLLYPPNFQPTNGTGLFTPNFGQESVSRLMEHLLLGVATKNSPFQKAYVQSNDWTTAVRWLPDEVQAFMNFAYRDLSNSIGALENFYKTTAERPGDRVTAPDKVLGYLRPMMQFADEFVSSAARDLPRYEVLANRTMSMIRASGAVNMPDPTITRQNAHNDLEELRHMTKDVGEETLKRTNEESMKGLLSNNESDDDLMGVKGAQRQLFGTAGTVPSTSEIKLGHEYRAGVETPSWSKWLALSYQQMYRFEKAGIPLAENATQMWNNLEPSYWRLTQSIRAPFMKTDEQGKMVYDPDHPVQQILQNKHPQSARALQAINTLVLWQNDNAKSITDPAAQDVVKREIGHLDPLMQQGVLEGVDSLVKSYKNAADMFFQSQKETVSSNVAKFMMMRDKSFFYDDAFKHAQTAVEGAFGLAAAQKNYTSAAIALTSLQNKAKAQPELLQSNDAQQAQMAVQQADAARRTAQQKYMESLTGLNPEQVATFEGYVGSPGTPGLAAKLVDLYDFFDKRKSWFTSEQRPGRFLIFGKTSEGEDYVSSQPKELLAKRRLQQLAGQGYSELRIEDREQADASKVFDTPDAIVNSFLKLEKSGWDNFLQTMQGRLSPADYQSLVATDYAPGQASARFVATKSMERYMQQREGVPGREELNAFEVFDSYSRRLVGAVARKGLRQQIDLLQRDPRLANQQTFKDVVNQSTDALLTPNIEKLTSTRAAMTAFFLGFPNVVTPIVVATHSMASVMPYLVRESGDWSGSIKRYLSAGPNLLKYMDTYSTPEGRSLLASAAAKETDNPQSMTKEESMAYYYKRARDEGRFSRIPTQQNLLSRDFDMLSQQAFGMGLGGVAPKSKGALAADAVYQASQLAMIPFSAVSAWNHRSAFLSALDMYYDQGFRGQELYGKSDVFSNMANFGGGKANDIGYVNQLSTGKTRSLFSFVNTLQRYSFGATAMFKDFLEESTNDWNKGGLKPDEVQAARKALTTAIAARVVLGGALAIPGSAILATAIQKLFPSVDLKQRAREFWKDLATRLGADDPLATAFANVAQNGVGGQFLGVDLSNRFALNSFLGFNSYDGFNAQDLLGVGDGIVEGAINAGRMVQQKRYVQAGTALLPSSMQPMVEMGRQAQRYGAENIGFRGQSENGEEDRLLMSPMTTKEKVQYALNVKPYRYRQFRDEQTALENSRQAYAGVHNTIKDDASSALLQGDNSKAIQYVQDYMSKTRTYDPQTPMNDVIDRALVQSHAQDLLSRIPAGNDVRAGEIAASFGDAQKRQSALGVLAAREKLNAQTGYMGGAPASGQEIQHAEMIDVLVRRFPNMTHGQADRIVKQMGM